MSEQDVFYFFGADFLTSAFNDVITPTDKVQVTFFVHAEQVTGIEIHFARQFT